MSRESEPVCVTGASGFVGSQVVADLLERGHAVRGTVRNPSDHERYGFLLELPGAAERLTLHCGQLLESGSFAEALEGCRWCIHTASPYLLDVDDPQRDLVDPAVRGTENVLQEALMAGVERVVVTSSMAAITDEPDADRILTEEDWNEKSSLKRNPYHLSKVEAERTAWRFDAAHEEISIVTINPFLVIGPSLAPTLNTSNQLFVDLLAGRYPGIINMAWGVVDIRDVSEAHIRAMERVDTSGRFICVDHTLTMMDIVRILREEGYAEGSRLPRLNLAHGCGDRLVRLLSYARPRGIGSFLRTHVGKVPRFDSTKSKRDLDMTYRPVRESIVETLIDLQRWEHLPR